MAAPCPPWLKQAWIDWLGPDRILELYGGTEAQAVTVITGDEWLEHRGSVGRVPSWARCASSTPTATSCRAGEVGEIWMRRGADAPPTYRYIGAEATHAAGRLGVARRHGLDRRRRLPLPRATARPT